MKLSSAITACLVIFSLCFCLRQSNALAASGNTTLRVATWNIAAKNHPDLARMTDLFAEKNIDIAGCQEIDVLNDRNPYDMAKAFANKTYPYVHFAKGRDFANGSFGVGVLSKYAFAEVSSVPIESTGSKATKTLERVVVEKDGKKIAFYNTHLSWENLDLRRRQIKEVADRVKADPIAYKIITADFNTDQHPYEYSMFLDQFNIANGLNGKWFDTYSEDDDPSMRVFTIDNIIATKNIKITGVGMVKSHLSDHSMLIADLALLDHWEGEKSTGNLALGQAVTVSSARQDVSPYLLVNCERQIPWISDASPRQAITIELDRLYAIHQITVDWGEERATRYRVSGSADGKTFTPLKEVKKSTGKKDVLRLSAPAKFLKFELTEKENASKGYEIREIQVFGDRVAPSPSAENLLQNGDMEAAIGNQPDAWALQITGEEANRSAYDLTSDFTVKYSGKSAARLTRSARADTSGGAMTQTIPLNANRRYQLSFQHRASGLRSGAFTYEINQKDGQGKTIDTHLVKLNDNVNMSENWRKVSYNFTASPLAESAEIALRLISGEGSLWIDDASVKEVIPTQSILLSAKNTRLSVGQRTKLTADILPKNASDLSLAWVSSDESVAAVDQRGNVTAVGAGQAYVGLVSDSELLVESKLLITVK